ncbi:MAG: pyridoxal phosphate-dependent aminotransferase [Runella slithyformis]|nr:MAG: pyridoxal phosphate-dependent aminotransferase [Runella slithyformis]TAF95820.1 MAG: pyridoxal phosphate-dependent aminotransferase [Runella sp.]TAG21672.1 MAG: pyridoxal phosphate-dependent aminotransferase [Cytophagales bacterium]TAG41064.1 MAG: pyridoxal phosphate-dependent aminotransferase [Cytophagia bacterium]TAF02382.1 MAG: pyridoxal phosphate-dependent aminotransferase [Runella slithyformis]
MTNIEKSTRLEHLRYDIRGPIYEKSLELESQGYKIINLNIGNPAPFGFDAPDEIVHDIILNIRNAQGYVDSRGLFAARKAVMHYTQTLGVKGVEINDVYIGNGVSELIVMSMQALLNDGDEILVPSPDYPLWTTAVALSGGKPVHYICDEQSDWNPDLDDLESKITPRTKGLVVINPNNPTGAVYDKEVLQRIAEIAERHSLIVFSDEIYDKILYDGAVHYPMATMVHDTLCITYGGLSKNYRAAGFRGGWLYLTGTKHRAKSYIEGLTFLASMRICANAPTQYAIQTALGGYQSIKDLVLPTGRLHKQMNLIYDRLTAIPGVSCVKPKGALYLFPKIDLRRFDFKDDQNFIFELLAEQKVLLVAGTGFNYVHKDHFRIVFLASEDELNLASNRIEELLEQKRIHATRMVETYLT